MMGNLYHLEGKHDLAMAEYEKAIEKDYKFWENYQDYSYYLLTAEALEDYQKIVDMCLAYLNNMGRDPDTYFNLSVAYMYTEQNEEAKQAFYKALKIDEERFIEYKEVFDRL